METGVITQHVEQIVAARRNDASGSAGVESALTAVTRLRAWLDASEADLARRLAVSVSFPESSIADTTRGSINTAGRTLDRSKTLDQVPDLAAALDDGAVTAGHIDAVTRTARTLEPEQRDLLYERCNTLCNVAADATTAEFGRRVRAEARQIAADDGMDRFAQQQRDSRLRSWVDSEGMWNLRGRFDPVTGVRIAARLDSAVETLFAEQRPATCPSDPIERQHHLRALALGQLLTENTTGTRAGRPEYVVVIHTDHSSTTSASTDVGTSDRAGAGSGVTVEWPIPVQVPWPILTELLISDDNDISVVVIGDEIVLHAPGELNLGRSTRLANRAQRRALRAMYSTCAIPGCATHYQRCKLHHIIWWRNGGQTNLDNLIPLCAQHHHKVHDDGWEMTLGPGRQLTITYPDGTIHNTGPPRRHAA